MYDLKRGPFRQRLGQLDTLVWPAAASSAGHLSTALPTIICMHGFGASSADLVPLASMLRVPFPVQWVFPNAPLHVDLGGGVEGRAWFRLPLEELQAALVQGQHLDPSSWSPAGMALARQDILDMVKVTSLPWSKIVLVGFSQGGILATDVTLHLPGQEKPAGLGIFSGGLVDSSNWMSRAAGKAGLRFFQSHGVRDAILSIKGARHLEELLSGAGLQGHLFEFPGGHEIPDMVLKEFSSFVRDIFK